MGLGGSEGSIDKTGRYRAVLEAQANSDLSVRQFCAEQGLAPSQFYYWRRRLGEMVHGEASG
jgi:transposase-like protein